MHALYYIARGQKTLGPCSKDDLRNFLAYGSIKDSDLVKHEHDEQWRPLSTLLELHAEGQISADGLTARPTRRRVARYRDYNRVPYNQRGGAVLRRMIMGFLFVPPLLWLGGCRFIQITFSARKRTKMVTSKSGAGGWRCW